MSEISQKYLKLLFCFMLFIGAKTFAQSPELNVKGDEAEKVRMNKLFVNVKVVGNIAYTTAEMHFFNSGTRQMEAELIFPLPENVSVSRYAIDINGKMREAVPVNKNKGKQVFEAIEHRRVDPGLLEKVDGNNFRTRIYPLMPNGERTVIIGYEEELSASDKDNLAYQLISRYPKKLDQFELHISVLGTSVSPIVQENSGEEIVFSKWNQSFQTSVKKENYQPSEKIIVKIPIQQNIPGVVMQNVGGQHYFYGNTFIEGNKIAKKLPASIGLIWDNSLSCKTRDLKKELNLLDAYFQKVKNTKVTLYFLNYTFEKQKEYLISNGNWSELKAVLETTKYDGGTRFSKISLLSHDEYLLFSDGLSSLSENALPKSKKPIYTITSSVSADFAFLNYSAMKTGGSFINLNQVSEENALDKLFNNNLKFLGIKENYTVTDLFPMRGTSVSGSFSFSGISLKPKNEITLLFSYNNEAVLERKISLDATLQNTDDINIEKLWAQKKIANLEYEYVKNADEIELLGKKYGIITKNTSLIVLENIRDYISYDIIPPAELRDEFDRIKKKEQDAALAKQKNNWESVGGYFTSLNYWWEKDIKYEKAKVVPKNNIKKETDGSFTSAAPVERGSDRIVINEGADLMIADEPVGKGPSTTVVNEASELKEVVINTYAPPARKREFTSSVQSISSTTISSSDDIPAEGLQIAAAPNNNTGVIRESVSVNLSTKPLLILDGKPFEGELSDLDQDKIASVDFLKDTSVTAIYGSRASNGVVRVVTKNGESNVINSEPKSWNPDRLYLKALAAAPKEKQYELYFEIRNGQEKNPSFYFDVAHFFYNQGDVKKALQVISNIADLGLENHQLYKTLTYTLRQWQDYEDALFTAKQVVKWRAHEPQGLRDYALILEDAGKYQEAFNQLIKALEANYYGEMRAHYAGVEYVILMDINRLISEHSGVNTDKLDRKYIKKMPVDIRIILNWNQMNVDLDLHVIEPNGEECYFGHRTTEAGATLSRDFTQGYGPEQYLIRNAIKGKYKIKTNYFGETKLTENGPATVMVEIYTTRAGKVSKTLKTIQLGKIKENEILAEIIW